MMPATIGTSSARPRPVRSVQDRVWSKVRRFRDPKRCWVWRGALSLKRNGKRPVIQLGRRGTPVVIVARLVCEWFHGPPPTKAHEAGHTCPNGENEKCIAPHHLRWMTRVENEAHKKTYYTDEVPF